MATRSVSAGILLFRLTERRLEVLIGHPGGPFWAKRQRGAWTLPKGLVEPGEDEQQAARREFEEETGQPVPSGEMVDLGEVFLKSGKRVVAWAVAGTFDVATARSNTVQIEWPRGSGTYVEFPEIDVFRWSSVDEAKRLLNPAQIPFLSRLQKTLDHPE